MVFPLTSPAQGLGIPERDALPQNRDGHLEGKIELATIEKVPPASAALRKKRAVPVVTTRNPPPITTADWRTYNHSFKGWRHNPAETHLSPSNLTQLRVKWQFPRVRSKETIGAINATPSVVNGYVYFGTSTHPKFYKLKPNGEIAWTYEPGDRGRLAYRRHQKTQGLVPRDGIYSSALVTEDSVYFADVTGVTYCLDRRTGEERWTLNTKDRKFPGAHEANLLMASPILAGKNVIFAGGAYEHSQPTNPNYKCCKGRGLVMALAQDDGTLIWKYDVGPKPEKFDPPLKMKSAWGTRSFHYGPSTSSVWSTPTYDPVSNLIFFGTDIHNSPRKPTKSDSRNYTPHSAAVIAVEARTGKERWVSQTTKGDVWNHSMPSYDPKTGYKDQSVGDSPKILTIEHEGQSTRVVGAGAKNGGFYLMRIADGRILAHTPIYTGPPTLFPKLNPRTLALPSPIGGLQTGCATDGKSIFTNSIDSIHKGTNTKRRGAPPTGGRVTSIKADTKSENWRHERPKVKWVGGTEKKPLFRNTGDPVASGIAVANGCLFFTTFTSNKLVALNASTGQMLKEISLGPVLAGPSVSRGRVYIGTGNTQFSEHPSEAYFPKSTTGILYSFGLPGEDEISRLGAGNE